ncbi:MAG: biotin biosynthesis protein BioY [Kaistia sp. SCN 65-12]|nr:MAG: biotin biosynthesis protein BioY [Kaistia sp. SCN 65-12]
MTKPRPHAFVPLLNAQLSAAQVAVLVACGALFLAASSYIAVPMVPVPVTMQTYAVMLVGALSGWRLGATIVLVWLAAGLAGLPVLAGGTGGIAPFTGPTAGYLASFPFAAAFCGWMAERGWTRRVGPSFLGFLLAQAICLVPGALWLATFVGPAKALAFGVTPFLVGAVIKAALAVASVVVISRFAGPSASAP